MTEPPLDPRERRFLRDVHKLADERSRAEALFVAKFTDLKAKGEAQSVEWRQRIDTRYAEEKTAAQATIDKTRRALANRLDVQRTEAQTTAETAKKRALSIAKKQLDSAEKKLRETRWEANTIFDAAQHDAVTSLKILNGRLAEASQTLEALAESAEEFLKRSHLSKLSALPPAAITDVPPLSVSSPTARRRRTSLRPPIRSMRWIFSTSVLRRSWASWNGSGWRNSSRGATSPGSS